MEAFTTIRQTADERRGGTAALKKLLPAAKSAKALKAETDDRYLSLMSRRVFSAGLKYSMVRAKWPAFEEVFLAFEPKRVRAISDERLERLMKDTRIIRHWGKIKATRANAAAMCALAEQHGSFAAWLAYWPADNVVGLWDELAQRSAHLGGSSGRYFLRMAGKDTFLLSRDVVKALNRWGGYDGEPKGKKARAAVQATFNAWAHESGLPLCHISQILALSVD